MKSKPTITCLNMDCPERFSLCCKKSCKIASEPEIMLGVPKYYCSGCGEEFKALLCNVIKRLGVPYCYSCHDKGWNSYLAVETVHADFPGDRTVSGLVDKRRYCGCKGGQKLKKKESGTRT